MDNRVIATGAGLFVAIVLTATGCQPDAKTTASKKDDPPAVAKKKGHEHWWCREHGIPEDECLVCLHSEDDLRKMNDWCELHDFAKSQCFKCNPKLREHFAAKYRAKYGKEPPPIDDDEEPKKDDKSGEAKDAGKEGKK